MTPCVIRAAWPGRRRRTRVKNGTLFRMVENQTGLDEVRSDAPYLVGYHFKRGYHEHLS